MNRYLVIETDQVYEHPEFRWMTLAQFDEFLRLGHAVNVQARSLISCLHSMCGREGVR